MMLVILVGYYFSSLLYKGSVQSYLVQKHKI